MDHDEFRRLIRQMGEELYRPMPWRDDTRPYYVLVSELMLQQTQVTRVIPKFQAFIAAFPDEASLADASLADILKLWQGLGYNRRAKFLHESAKRIVNEFGGVFPADYDDMLSLPGVGRNTAGAISAYAFNQPVIFVETNVRTAYIHHFFSDDFEIDDKTIIAKLEATLDHERPRHFYWALMDYGSWLKTNGVRNNASSKHYKKQAPLEGSLRQMRGRIVRQLTLGAIPEVELRTAVQADERFGPALEALKADGLVSGTTEHLHLTK